MSRAVPPPQSSAIGVVRAPQVCLILDDIFPSAAQAMAYLERYGYRCSLATTSDYLATTLSTNDTHLSGAGLIHAVARGHEILNHSKTHADMTGLVTATRATEFDTSQTALEALAGVGNVTSWVYPSSARDVNTDHEAYSRFQRAFSGTDLLYLFEGNDRERFAMGRWNWVDSTHSATLALVSALKRGQVLVMYTHKPDGSDLVYGPTWAKFTQLVDMCARKGIQMVTIATAFGTRAPIPDAKFTDSTLSKWWVSKSDGTITVEQVTGETDATISGDTALHINSPSGSKNGLVRSFRAIPVDAGVAYALSARLRTANFGSGSSGAALQILEYASDGTAIGNTIGTPVTANNAYQQVTVARTMAANASYVRVAARLVNRIGDAYFKSLAWGRTSEGVFG